MFFEIVTDCRDQHSLSRVSARVKALFKDAVCVNAWGLGGESADLDKAESKDLQASGFLIDLLDATMGKEGIIMVNVAPRHGSSKKWPNGTPFCYFYIGETLILSSIEGLALSLVKKFGITDHVHLMDIPQVMKAAVEAGQISESEADDVVKTQFRSYQFLPRAAFWIWNKKFDMPSEKIDISEVDSCGKQIWHIDNFGNAKTTILPEEISFKPGETIETKFGELPCYERLSHVPDHTAAVITGSSGTHGKRFLELVIQGASAKDRFGFKIGDEAI